MPSPAEAQAPLSGATLGPYRVEDRLGEGGMGVVYRAMREADGEVVALKVLKRKFSGDPQYTRRFLREARAAGEVRHPRLVPVLDVGEDGGQHWLAMRYVPGRTLEQRVREDGPLPLDALLRVTFEMAEGLDALHQAGVVHRDIKSSNILLGPDGAAALTDFGLARGRGYSSLTTPGQIMGTLDYLAPELIRGEPATPASDLYSLGCVVFECLCGEPPFGGESVFQAGLAHLQEEPGDPCANRGEIPLPFSAAVLDALAKDPARRPPGAMAYATALSVAARC